jgi:hypothetical protein
MKLLFFIALTGLCGCSSTNITKLTQALAKDPAIVVVKIGSVYGTLSFVRVGSQTNGVTVSPDGSVSIK